MEKEYYEANKINGDNEPHGIGLIILLGLAFILLLNQCNNG